MFLERAVPSPFLVVTFTFTSSTFAHLPPVSLHYTHSTSTALPSNQHSTTNPLTLPMSDITPPSYIDDGASFSRRLPASAPHANVAKWLDATGPGSETSAYTGSYIDDGADLLPPTVPGFGRVNPLFYKPRRRREGNEGVWSADVARAVQGDMARSLAKLRGTAGIQVKRAEPGSAEGRKRRGVVCVPAPPKWGAFVIRGDDGRVVVVDERGEFDSGPVAAVARDMEGKETGPWVRAASSVDTPVSTLEAARYRDAPGSGKSSQTKSKAKTHASPRDKKARKSKPLSPIPESGYESDDPVKISPLASPTNFFMTGGLSGWPSRAASPDPGVPVVPHAITWATTPASRTLNTGSKLKSTPPAGPAESASSSSSTRLEGRRSKHSSRLYQPGQKCDKASTKTHSTYKAPDVVEVVYDETPLGETSHSQTGWGDVDSDKKRETGAWDKTGDTGTVKSFGHDSTVSDLEWGGSAKGSGWGGSKSDSRASKTGSFHGWDVDEKHSNTGDKEEWDGFERPKTTSEVSVAGSSSERSWPASQRSQHSHRSHRTGRSHRSHKSHRSSRHSSTGWDNDQTKPKAGSAVHWGNSDAQSEQSVSKSKHGSEASWPHTNPSHAGSSPTRYKNGFDEDNATYLNETWGGVPVRVASRRTSVAGWDRRTLESGVEQRKTREEGRSGVEGMR